MAATLTPPTEPSMGIRPLILRVEPVLRLTQDEFFQFCQDNPDWQIERNANGEVSIMPPSGWESGTQSGESFRQLANWAKEEGRGRAADASAGFELPNGATRSPDAAWVLRSRLDALPVEVRRKFLPLCPDFAIEVLSPTDSLAVTQAKMQEYLDNGLRLGILLDPRTRRAFIYRPGASVQELTDPEQVACDPELPGFTLNVREVFDADT